MPHLDTVVHLPPISAAPTPVTGVGNRDIECRVRELIKSEPENVIVAGHVFLARRRIVIVDFVEPGLNV